MFGKNRGAGKKLIELEDGTSMLCDMDEFGNIIPNSCEPLVGKSQGSTEVFEYPKPKLSRRM